MGDSSRSRATIINPENAVLIAVKRQWFAMLLKILAGGHHVVKRRFSLAEAEMHQTASSIINEDEQAAFGGASFKPVMRRTINLNKYAGIWIGELGACDVSMEPRVHQPSSIF